MVNIWCGLWTSCRCIQQYQNLQRWSVAHCELQNSSVMLSLYVGASVVQSPPVTSVMARGTWYCLSRPPIPSTSPWIRCTWQPSLPTMKVYFEGFPSTTSRYGIATPYSMCLIPSWMVPRCVWLCVTDCVYMYMYVWCHCVHVMSSSSPSFPQHRYGFDAVSVQNVGSTYIIVSWDLPTHSNGILINFSLYCNGALVGVLPLTVISYNTTGLLPFTLYMYMYVFSATVCNMRK